MTTVTNVRIDALNALDLDILSWLSGSFLEDDDEDEEDEDLLMLADGDEEDEDDDDGFIEKDCQSRQRSLHQMVVVNKWNNEENKEFFSHYSTLYIVDLSKLKSFV